MNAFGSLNHPGLNFKQRSEPVACNILCADVFDIDVGRFLHCCDLFSTDTYMIDIYDTKLN